MRYPKLGLLPAALALVAACDGGGRSPTGAVAEGRWIEASLTTPNPDDGAVLVEVSGRGILAIEGLGADARVRMRGDSAAAVVLTGEIGSGPLLRVRIASSALEGELHATVLQAAERATFRQQPVAGYSVTFLPAPPASR